jgi:DUF971 family protein
MSEVLSGPAVRPVEIQVERAAGTLRLVWADGHASLFALPWLRANCPCATCREERREAAESSGLRLMSGPPPSTQIASAELVGAYALRLVWSDGHDAGIYPFSALRAACPCGVCTPSGPVPLLPDEAPYRGGASGGAL